MFQPVPTNNGGAAPHGGGKASERIQRGRESDPTIEDFHHDMNDHNARYGRLVGATTHILELERFRPTNFGVDRPGRFRLVVWRAIRYYPDGYVAPLIDGNRYTWDAVGEAEWTDDEDGPDAAQETFRRLKSGDLDLGDWLEANPYDGPRRRWQERFGVADE